MRQPPPKTTGRELYGVPCEALIDDWLSSPIHPADREACFASIEEAAQTRAPWKVEFRLLLADGYRTRGG